MTKIEHLQYWKLAAEKDRNVVQSLFEKGNYPQALFFGHLILEKLIKAHWVNDNEGNIPPKIHNLLRLASQTRLTFAKSEAEFLDKLNDYQLEGRYPDYQFKLYKICTKNFAETMLAEVEKIEIWLRNQLP